MKPGFKHFLSAYFLTYVLFILYFYLTAKDCKVYWMHDASMDITRQWIIITCCWLFLLPVAILCILHFLKENVSTTLFLSHYLFSLISISSIALILNIPPKIVDSKIYIMGGFEYIAGHYLFKLAGFITICVMGIKTVGGIIKKTSGPKP